MIALAVISAALGVVPQGTYTLEAGEGVAVQLTLAGVNTTYAVTVDGAPWLASAPAGFAVSSGGKLFTAGPGCNENCLSFVEAANSSGKDAIGSYQEIGVTWEGAAPGTSFITAFRTYTGVPVVVFEQRFPQGLPAALTAVKKSHLGTAFPAWRMEGDFMGLSGKDQNHTVGPWANTSFSAHITGGSPQLLMREVPGRKAPRSIVMSPFDHFMSAGLQSPTPLFGEDVRVSASGIIGTIASIPAGYTYPTVLTGGYGVSSALMDWGDVLLTKTGKTRTALDNPHDKSLTTIGYWTDNGAWYHYLCSQCCEPQPPGPGGLPPPAPCPCPAECSGDTTMEEVMLEVKADAVKREIPYKYFMFDSWWYPKRGDPGANSSKSWPFRSNYGMLSWTPEPQVFPSGTADWLGLPTFLHARYLDLTNDYRKIPELEAEMICEAERDVGKSAGGVCIPVGKKVFEKMMGGVQGWRPFVYEQDWIVLIYKKSQSLTNSTDVGELWTRGMNEAALSFNMSIQFSMSLMPAIMQSSKMQAVTQIRGGADYTAGSDQWMVGVQSSFYYALGAVVSKDTFWTTKHQPGCPKAGDYNCTEPNVEVQVIIATLSGGPVGPGDRLGMTDRRLAMRSCNEDGRILRPTFPLAALDRAATGPAEKTLWSAYSSFTGIAAGFHFVFYAGEEPMRITPSDLLVVCSNTTLGARRCHEGGAGAVDDEEFVAVSITQTGGVWPAAVELQTVSETEPLVLSPPKAPQGSAGVVPFSYVMLAPNAARGLGGSSWVILGELDKVVPVSPGRFGAATATSAGLTWELKGAVGEVVAISYTRTGTLALRTVQCTMDTAGRAVLMCDTDQCHC